MNNCVTCQYWKQNWLKGWNHVIKYETLSPLGNCTNSRSQHCDQEVRSDHACDSYKADREFLDSLKRRGASPLC